MADLGNLNDVRYWLDISSTGLNLNMYCTFCYTTFISVCLSYKDIQLIINRHSEYEYLQHLSRELFVVRPANMERDDNRFVRCHFCDITRRHAMEKNTKQKVKVYMLVDYITKYKYINML